MTQKREEGFYWVNWPRGGWQPARFVRLGVHFHWEVFGDEESYYDGDFTEVGPRIPAFEGETKNPPPP